MDVAYEWITLPTSTHHANVCIFFYALLSILIKHLHVKRGCATKNKNKDMMSCVLKTNDETMKLT